jgi:uncharacterized protein (DUF302 family)
MATEVDEMAYYFSKQVSISFSEAIARVTDELKKEGFGILTEIDVRATLKKKLDVDFRDYRILGTCNPPFAYEALKAEEKIGLMLPCNVIVQATPDGGVEVAAIDPVASMSAVGNPGLEPIGLKVREKLRKVIEAL